MSAARDLGFGASVVLPVQLRAEPPALPERALALAVLENAIRTLEDPRPTPGGRRRRAAREAEAWLRDDDRRWPFSFVNLCEALGFEAAAIRRALLARQPPGPRPGSKA